MNSMDPLSEVSDSLKGLLGSEELQNKLAFRLCHEIDASNDAKGRLIDRWRRNEAIYNLDPSYSNLNLIEGMESYAAPLWTPKANRIIGTVFKAVTSLDPYCQVLETDDEAKSSRIEKSLMALANRGPKKKTFDRAFHMALKTSVNTNCSLMHPYMDTTNWRVCFAAIHPRDAVVYPHELGSIEEAKTVGHRAKTTRADIDARFEAKEYLTNIVSPKAAKEEAGKSVDFDFSEPSVPVTVDDDLIDVYELVTTYENEKVLCRVAYDSQKLLKIESYPYSRPWYFDIRFGDEYGSFWPSSSPGQDVQSCQVIFSDLFNVALHGSYVSAFPVTLVSGAGLAAKVMQARPGMIIPTSMTATVQTIQTQFEPGIIPMLLEKVEELGDSVTGVGRLGTSQNLPSGATATEANGLLQAQDQAYGSFTTFVAPAVAEIFEFLAELLASHLQEIRGSYGAIIEVQDGDLDGKYLIEPTGKSLASSPQVLVQKLQMLLNMAANPLSSLDYQKVEDAVIQALQLPMEATGLIKQMNPQALANDIGTMLQAGVHPEQILIGVTQTIHQLLNGTPQASPPNPPGAPGVPSGPAPPGIPQPGQIGGA